MQLRLETTVQRVVVRRLEQLVMWATTAPVVLQTNRLAQVNHIQPACPIVMAWFCVTWIRPVKFLAPKLAVNH